MFKVRQATKKGYDIAYLGDSINLEQPNSKTRRGRVGKQIINTLTTSCHIAVVVEGGKNMEYRIRKLTPKECWRLMGFKDEQFNKAAKVCSNSQLYKQAGNSIVVNVMEAIFKKLI
ncbi:MULTISPECIES: DNA cytosine methyltransferase [unclassified Clostridium]|uniref:DNA cytosine methyltransferase n=1 Tax=unclassified Clostridium TaxID=2614128 RepID=UPI0013F80C55|nr:MULTISPECIES: DNA cytosine methyltransferase [unclassified Clostridium]NFR85783.1 DNA methyltransferase [Clostridium botulinum]NFR91417.1 DNA methyltransferase [Clostridium botulinum]NFT99314.1 DNA methyltransferase [Clostridium botulinum]